MGCERRVGMWSVISVPGLSSVNEHKMHKDFGKRRLVRVISPGEDVCKTP